MTRSEERGLVPGEGLVEAGDSGDLLPKREVHTEAEAVGTVDVEEEWLTGHLSADADSAAAEEVNEEWSTGHWSEEVAAGRATGASAALGRDCPPNHDDQEELCVGF